MSQTWTVWVTASAGAMSRHTYDENGVPCNSTTGGPEPNTSQATSPWELGKRRPNYGFEGLTGDETGRTLVATVQTPLDNPRAAGRESIVVRLVVFDTESRSTRQFLYLLDAAGFFGTP